MRTLKKVLALTVVLATLLSISAFAAFSDEESIDESFVDAVNLLGALNVMTGDTEGTFRPNDTIMRAEAAKMIYVIRNGGVDDQAAGWTGMSTFSDVPSGAWYEGYVNYCASLGIIAGVGNGLFNPNGAVTGVELAKMMLVVADYRPDIEKYTGAGWNLNVIRDAQTAGMFKGYTLAYSAAATRQQAAQLFANAILETEMAVYIGDVRVNNAAMLGTAETVGGRFFGLYTATGILTKVPHVSLPLDVQSSYTDQNGVTHAGSLNGFNGDTSDINADDDLAAISNLGVRGCEDAVFEFAADPDLLYQEVDVIFREDTDDPGVLSRDSKVYAVLPTGNTYVYDTTMDAITIAPSDETKAAAYPKKLGTDGNPTTTVDTSSENYNPMTIKFEGYNGNRAKVLASDFELPVITNLYEGAELDNITITNGVAAAEWDRKTFVIDPETVEELATTSIAPVRLIDYNRDGNLDIAFVTTPYYGTVTNYNADRFEFTTNAAINNTMITSGRDEDIFVNFTFEDDIEKDDVIAVTIDVLSGEMMYNVALVEPVTGTLTRVYSTDPDNEVVIGGETYGFYGLKFGNRTLAQEDLDADAYHDELGSEVTVYTDGKYILTAEVAPASLGTGFAFVKNYNVNGNSADKMNSDSRALVLELVLPDGELVQLEYDRDADAADGVYTEDKLVNNFDDEDETKRTATALLEDMIGNIVEVNIDGDFVTIDAKDNRSDDVKAELEPTFHDDDGAYQYNNESGLFRKMNVSASSRRGLAVNENTVLFLPTYKDADLEDVAGNISKVAVITGDELRGMPVVTTEDNTGHIMQLVSCLQGGVKTVAYAALDAGTSVSDTGVFAYTVSPSWHQDEDENNEYRVQGVLSNSGNDDISELTLTHDKVLANKVYHVTENSDNTYDFDQVVLNKETENGTTVKMGAIRGTGNNTVSILAKGERDTETYIYDPDTTVVYIVDVKNWGDPVLADFNALSDALGEDTDKDGKDDVWEDNVLFEYDTEQYLTVVYVEAAGRDVEALISYEVTASMSFTSGDFALPKLFVGAPVVNKDADHFSIEMQQFDGNTKIPTDKLAANADSLELKVTAKTGSLFDEAITKKDANGGYPNITVPDGYDVTNASLSDDYKTLTVKVDITETISTNVTEESVELLAPEVDVMDRNAVEELPTAQELEKETDREKTVTLDNEDLNDNAMVEQIELTYGLDGAEGAGAEVVVKTVEVTFTEAYKEGLNNDILNDVLAAIAEKLGLNANDVTVTTAGAMIMAAARADNRPVVTTATYDAETGVLTLTIVENPVSFEFTAAKLEDRAEDPEQDLYANYSIDVTDNGDDHYTVTIHATDLKKHTNESQKEGYWVGVQIGSFSNNVKGWKSVYRGYADSAAVDAAFESEETYVVTNNSDGENLNSLTWYRDAEKDSDNNKERDWTVGIQLLDDEDNVLKTVYVTINVDNITRYEESAEDAGTESEVEETEETVTEGTESVQE